MAGKLLEIDPAALAELGSTVAWYLKRSEAAASEFVAEVDRAIGRVIESPGRWPTGEQATHKFVLRRFPYAIIYRERETTVQILAVAHGHRRPGYWQDRM
jgi:plasmid stabilization system protein ParE